MVLEWSIKPNIYEYEDEYRFILGVSGEKPLVCIGFNPSTATNLKPNQTLKRVESIAEYNEYDGWIMLNIYPQRAIEPNDLECDINKDMHDKILLYIKDIFRENKKLWASWGTLIETYSINAKSRCKRSYLKNCLKDIILLAKEYNCEWLSAAITEGGHPKHPLYTKKSKLSKFDIDDYRKKFKI